MTDTDFHPTMIDNHPGALVNLTQAEKRWWLLHQVYSPPAQPATEDSTPIVVARRKNGTGSNLDLSSVSVDTSAFTSLPGIAATVKIATNNSIDAIVSMPDIKSIFSEVRENLPLPVSQKIDVAETMPELRKAYTDIKESLPAAVQQSIDAISASPDVKTVYSQLRDSLPANIQQKVDAVVASPDAPTVYAQVRDALSAVVQQKLDTIVSSPDAKTAYAQVRDALPAAVQQKLDSIVASPDAKTAYAQVRDTLPAAVQQKLDPVVSSPDVQTAYAQVRDALPAVVQQKLDPIVASPDVQTAYAQVRDALPAVVQQKLDPIIASPDAKTAYAQVRDALPGVVQQKLDPIVASPDAKTAYAQVRDALPAAVQQKLDTTFPSADPKTVVSPTKDSMSIVVSQKIDVTPKLADSLAINAQPISVESLNKVSASQASDAVKGTKIAELRSEPLAQNIVIALPASFSAATRIGSDNYFSKLTPGFDKTQLPTDRNIVGFSATKISAVPVTTNSAEFFLTNRNLYEVAGKQSIFQHPAPTDTLINNERPAIEATISVAAPLTNTVPIFTPAANFISAANFTPATTFSPAVIASASPTALVGNLALETKLPVSPLSGFVAPVEATRSPVSVSPEIDVRPIKTPIVLPTNPIAPITFAPVGPDGQRITIRFEPIDTRGSRIAVIVTATGQRIPILSPVTVGARCGAAQTQTQTQTSSGDKVTFSTRRIFGAGSDRYLTGIEFAIFIAATGIAKTRKGEIDAAAGKLCGGIARRLGQIPQAATEKASEEEITNEVTTQTKSEPKVCTRPVWFVSPGDTLQSIAIQSTGDARFGWLIADLNRATIDQTSIDGKRVVELRTMQKLELPVWQDLVDFKATIHFEGNVDNLITIISERHIDREAVSASLEKAMGLRPTAKPVAQPVAEPNANPIAKPMSKPATTPTTKPAWLPQVWIAPRPAVSVAAAISLVLPFQAVLNSQDPATLESAALNIGTVEAKHD